MLAFMTFYFFRGRRLTYLLEHEKTFLSHPPTNKEHLIPANALGILAFARMTCSGPNRLEDYALGHLIEDNNPDEVLSLDRNSFASP